MPLVTNVVAVDQGLDNVEAVLKAEGYQVISTKHEDLSEAVAVVVNGLDENLMGIEEIVTASTVIDASGLSLNQVLNQVNRARTLQS
jgi:hypothetical protein